MQVRSFIRRSVAVLIMTAGLAYPACAAVCPKGIGGCPSPGRCFLFTDADKNLLCDYTSRTGSQTIDAVPSRPGAPVPAQTAVPATAAPSPDPTAVQVTAAPTPASPAVSATTAPASLPDTTTTLLQNTSGGGFFETIHLSVPVAEVLLFLIVTGILFVLIRKGVFGIQACMTRPALALSAFFGLCISLILTCILAGGAIAGTLYALIWIGAGTPLAAYLWHEGVMTRRSVLGAALLGTLAGFVFLAPVMPVELGGIVNVITGVSALTPGIIVICAIILLALVFGRAFCGNICPVGSLQEMAYDVPVEKIRVQRTRILELVRFAVFVSTIIAAVYLVDLMAVTGLYDLFSLTISAGLVTAAGLVLVSAFLYRPVCRILCPFGVLFAIPAGFSLFRLRRTEKCITCKKCEKACPARTAGADDPKRECYLCARCKEACPVSGALEYRR
ncbi:MAG: 4Fe-4S binding protein [Methanoregula sp.]|nr:4Fe-4S binding protein [Methanoregula sp.]